MCEYFEVTSNETFRLEPPLWSDRYLDEGSQVDLASITNEWNTKYLIQITENSNDLYFNNQFTLNDIF